MIYLSQLPWGLTASLLAATLFGAQPACAGPSVEIAMKAAFPSAPYLIELLYVYPLEAETASPPTDSPLEKLQHKKIPRAISLFSTG